MTNINNLNVGVEVMRYLRQLHDVAKFEKLRDTANLFEDLYYVNLSARSNWRPLSSRALSSSNSLPETEQESKSVSEAVAAINRRYGAMCSELKTLSLEVMALYGADTDEKETEVNDMLDAAWESYKFVFVDHEFKE